MAKQFDEPGGDQAIIPTYLISKVIGKEAKVALSGDGGDELFAGYGHYAWIEKQNVLRRRMPRTLRCFLLTIQESICQLGLGEETI